ncbi:hypothetical protein [Chryseobacterium oryzae]|uniref:Lipocalin-like domain-containing protein n=1 Tax=Chryseobacterium oryzae TaxID=2929799 RepID=A0ABY4BGC4_9FLAO|nr:hypothetical protein [Chryseobacterium oryzae]UOE37031.1 hypothetical protein MTP08_08095 [Chryseobacterium oryzae]
MKTKLFIFLILALGIFVKSQNCIDIEEKVLLKDNLSLNVTDEVRNLLNGKWQLQKITDDKNKIRTLLNEKFNPEMDYIENNYDAFITYNIEKEGYESIMTFPGNEEVKQIDNFKFIYLKKKGTIKYFPKIQKNGECWGDANEFPLNYVDETTLKTYYNKIKKLQTTLYWQNAGESAKLKSKNIIPLMLFNSAFFCKLAVLKKHSLRSVFLELSVLRNPALRQYFFR